MTSRWHGKIGFGVTKEIGKGIWKPTIEEREYYGNIISVRKTAESQPYSTNDALRINSKISIIDDGFISVNCATIRYVYGCFMESSRSYSRVPKTRPNIRRCI